MRSLLKLFGILIVAVSVVLFGTLIVIYLAVGGGHSVPATVQTDADLPRIELDDITLHGETWGNSEAAVVIVLHGGPGGDYRSLLPLTGLANWYYLVFYDQRGAGLSPRVDDEQMTIETYWRDLEGVIETHAGDRPVVLLGHSWGAMLASSFVAQHPDRVAGLVLAEPGFLTNEAAADFMQKTNHMMPPLGWRAIRGVVIAGAESMHAHSSEDGDASIDYLMRQIMFTDVPGHPIAGYFCGDSLKNGALDDWRFGARVSSKLINSVTTESGAIEVDFTAPNYEGPALFITGSCNRIMGTEHQKKHHVGRFRLAELVQIEGAGHTMLAEKPEESMRVIRQFLDRVFAKASTGVSEPGSESEFERETEAEGVPQQ